jgi:hypothetical protein
MGLMLLAYIVILGKGFCCDVAVAQINYPSLKHNTQDSIEKARGRSHEKDLVQIFILYVMQLGGFNL